LQAVVESKLWPRIDRSENWRKVLEKPEIRSGPWAFWIDWYEGFLNGQPLDWDLQREIALIPNEDWEKGAEHIAQLIDEIRGKREPEPLDCRASGQDQSAARDH
jgi:hypothetical protein